VPKRIKQGTLINKFLLFFMHLSYPAKNEIN